MKEIFEEYISEARMAKYQPVQTYCGMIEKEQALQDIEQLIYIIDNRYCGKEYIGLLIEELLTIIFRLHHL